MEAMMTALNIVSEMISESESDDSDDDSDSDDVGDSDSDGDADGPKDSTSTSKANKIKTNFDKEDSDDFDKKKKYEKTNKGVKKHENGNGVLPLKNMPVNMLRDLAKTKLAHLEQPAINKMSKKEILKALDN